MVGNNFGDDPSDPSKGAASPEKTARMIQIAHEKAKWDDALLKHVAEKVGASAKTRDGVKEAITQGKLTERVQCFIQFIYTEFCKDFNYRPDRDVSRWNFELDELSASVGQFVTEQLNDARYGKDGNMLPEEMATIRPRIVLQMYTLFSPLVQRLHDNESEKSARDTVKRAWVRFRSKLLHEFNATVFFGDNGNLGPRV